MWYSVYNAVSIQDTEEGVSYCEAEAWLSSNKRAYASTNLQDCMVYKLRPICPEARESHVRITYKGGAISVDICRSRYDDCEGIICGSHSRSLHFPIANVVDEA